MNYWRVIFLSFFVNHICFAQFSFSPGVMLVDYGNATQYDNNNNVLAKNDPGIGLGLDSELYLPLRLSLVGHLSYFAFSSAINYNYTNAENPGDTAQVKDLDAAGVNFTFEPGLRFYLLKLKKFNLYLGTGVHYGYLHYSYDSETFQKRTANLIGYLESDSSSLEGRYQEIGMRFLLKKKGGLQLSYKKLDLKSNKKMQTMNNQKMKISGSQIHFSYVHSVDWNFFWK